MSSVLILSNVHLGVELFGAIVFFITTWLFFEAYLIKKDVFSFGRALGFFLLSVWQILHAIGGEGSTFLIISFAIYSGGLLLVLLSYALEKLPPKPVYAVFGLPLLNISGNFYVLPTILSAALALFLIKRYYRDIDRVIKWLAIGFVLVALSSFVANYANADSPNSFWFLEHALKVAVFLSIGAWIFKFLSLRAREEALIIFIANSLFIALLVTTTFSAFFLKNLERETLVNLAAQKQTFNFYADNLKNKALAASQIIANNADFISAVSARDTSDMEKIGKSLLGLTGGQFLTVAAKNGVVFFKSDFPILQDENILAQSIGGEALEGHTAATVDSVGPEGLSLKAASPIISQGKIIGTVLTGYLLDKDFTEKFKETTGFETSIFADEKVTASSILVTGAAAELPQEEFLGTTKISGQEVIGNFLPLKNAEGKTVATLALTTTPGAILRNAQSTNRLTMLIIALIVVGLIIPLYRFTIFLAG